MHGERLVPPATSVKRVWNLGPLLPRLARQSGHIGSLLSLIPSIRSFVDQLLPFVTQRTTSTVVVQVPVRQHNQLKVESDG